MQPARYSTLARLGCSPHGIQHWPVWDATRTVFSTGPFGMQPARYSALARRGCNPRGTPGAHNKKRLFEQCESACSEIMFAACLQRMKNHAVTCGRLVLGRWCWEAGQRQHVSLLSPLLFRTRNMVRPSSGLVKIVELHRPLKQMRNWFVFET